MQERDSIDELDEDLSKLSDGIEVEKMEVGFLTERINHLRDFFKNFHPRSNGNGNGSNGSSHHMH